MKLSTQLSLAFIPLLFLSGLGTTYVARRSFHKAIVEEAANRGKAKLEGIAALTQPGVEASREDLLLPILTSALTREGAIFVMVIDAQGRVLADTNVLEKGKVYSDPVTLNELRSADPTSTEVYNRNRPYIDLSWPLWTQDESSTLSSEELLLLGSQSTARKRLGTLKMGLPLDSALETEFKVSRQLVFLLVFADSTLLVLVFLLMRGILRPVNQLVKATQEIGSGIYGARIPLPSATELSNLAKSFNQMSQALVQTTVSKNFLDNILENMLEPLIVLDAERRIRLINRAALSLLNYTADELQHQPFQRLWSPSNKIELPIQKEISVKNKEVLFQTKSGDTVPVLFSSLSFGEKDQEAPGYIVVAIDMRERKKLESDMLQTEKLSAVGRLASGVAHEINNPLGVILGFAQGILFDLAPEDDLQFPLKSIEREAVRCKNLVQDLLTFSRVSKTERSPLDLNAAVQGALSLVTAQARVGNVEVKQTLTPDLPHVLGNMNQIQQVVVNLANNALDAMSEKGTLTVGTSGLRENSRYWVVLSVVDTGSGIPADVLPRIFEPFFTTKGIGKGTGLGLGLVHEIVQKHSATIEVESRPGHTEFKVKFPAGQPQATPPGP